MKISRRDFLKYLGMTSAGVSLVGLGCDVMWSVPDEVYEKIGGAPRIETWKTSICSLCPGGCGIKVRLIDGIPVRIVGNPLNPVNRGGVCPMAEAGVEALFNPDRIKEPLKRVGERGEEKWEAISWDEALQTVVTRLQALREKNAAHKLAFFSGNSHNLLSSLIERFMQAFGSPNLFVFNQNTLSSLVTYITQGHENPLVYNFDDIELLLNFGADLLDEGPSPIRFNQLYSDFRNRGEGKNVKVVHIDSRLSRTASNSKEWLPIKPGTMAALALGMANVLIKDRQYDRDFVNNLSFGFEDWHDRAGNPHTGFKSLVEDNYYPEKVAKITGVPANRIVEVAREFGAAKSALVLAGGQAVNSSNSLYTLWAIECLNALKGNYKNDGIISVAKEPPYAKPPKVNIDKIAAEGLRQPELTQLIEDFCFAENAVTYLPKAILDNSANLPEMLFLANANPVFNSTNQSDFEEVLKEIPFIVSFSSFLDDTSVYADLILPDHVFLEKHEVIHTTPMVEFSHLGMQQPVIKPFYHTRHVGDVILEIARKLGGSVASSFKWADYQEFLKSHLKGIYKTGAGTIFTERMDEAWLKFLKERGWQIFEYTTFEEFLEVLLENGGWWNPFPSVTDFRKFFNTPSKKFEFYSRLLEKKFNSEIQAASGSREEMDLLLKKWHVEARGDLVFLPHYEELKIKDDSGRFDYHLLPYRLITNVNGEGSNLPLLQELFGMLTRNHWETWVEINPETAHKHGIKEGEMVKVTSPKGNLELAARLLPGISPDVLYIPFGLGHKTNGRYVKGIGVNPYSIILEDFDFLSGVNSLICTKVMIEKGHKKEIA
ncbi:MAG: molybdopterin-dependent oxidoreductase [bacterium]